MDPTTDPTESENGARIIDTLLAQVEEEVIRRVIDDPLQHIILIPFVKLPLLSSLSERQLQATLLELEGHLADPPVTDEELPDFLGYEISPLYVSETMQVRMIPLHNPEIQHARDVAELILRRAEQETHLSVRRARNTVPMDEVFEFRAPPIIIEYYQVLSSRHRARFQEVLRSSLEEVGFIIVSQVAIDRPLQVRRSA